MRRGAKRSKAKYGMAMAQYGRDLRGKGNALIGVDKQRLGEESKSKAMAMHGRVAIGEAKAGYRRVVQSKG